MNKVNSEVKNSVLSRFTQPVIDLLLKRTAVYTDVMRGVEQDNSDGAFRYSADLPSKIDCLIVGKEHYSQSVQAYPIQSLKEIRNILNLERQNSAHAIMYVIGPYVEGSRIVISWHINQQALVAHGLSPLLVIPEAALLLAEENNDLMIIERANRTFWFSRRQNEYICAEKKGLIANEMMFLASAGLNEQIEKLTLDDNAYLKHMFVQLPQVLLTQWFGLKTQSKGLREIDWMTHFKYSGIAGALVVAVYLGVSSLYLNVRLESVKTQSAQLAIQTKDVFALKADYNRLQETTTGFNDATKVEFSSNLVWRLVGPLIQSGVKVERVSMLPEGIYILNLEAKSATEVLEFIGQDEGVIEAKFRGETSTVKGKEQFAISFKVAKKAQSQDGEA